MRPTLDRLPGRRLLPIAILQVLLPAAPAAWAAQGIEVAPPSCTAGTAGCAARPLDWGMCGKNDLLDFHVADLPTEGDRDSVARDVSALKVSSPDNSRYVLEGKAEIRQLDLLLRAEKITYDADTSDYTAQGPITYQDRGLLLAADAASGNADRDQCTLEGVRYQLLGSRGNGVASVAITTDIDHARLTGATFSTCDVANQQWAFAAREIELDRVEGIGRARDVTFRVRNVPVFWLPYARFPLDDRRVSGFLFPNVGFSDRRGFDLTLPYYFNIAPNYDATLAPRLMTERGLMLGGEFRYLADASSGTFNFEFLPDDRRADDEAREYGENIPDSRWWYQWRDTTRFNQTWGANVDLNRVSDARYFEDFGRGLYSSAVSFLPSRAYVHGRGESWSASIGGDDYQITDPTLPERFEPYRRLPRATFDAERALLGPLEGGIDAEFVAFAKDDAVDGRRLDLYPHLSLRLEGAAWFLKPELGYRYTRYELEDLDEADNPLLGSDDPHRGTPIFSLDGGLVFERELEFGGEAWTQTFEPRAYYLRVPYRDQGDIPLFDTQQIPFTFSELFRSNRFVGADRQMDANNLSLALTTRFLENATGEERVSASIGQIRYFDDQRVQLPGREATDHSGSAYAGQLALRLSDRWRVAIDQQYNPNTDHTDLSTVTLQNRFAGDGVANLSYRYRRDFLEQVDFSTAIPLAPGWRLIARENYALNEPRSLPVETRGEGGRSLERFLGIEHDTCCIAWRLIARRWVHNIEGEYDTALYFELEFKGVGSVGQKTDGFLRRGILGYQ